MTVQLREGREKSSILAEMLSEGQTNSEETSFYPRFRPKESERRMEMTRNCLQHSNKLTLDTAQSQESCVKVVLKPTSHDSHNALGRRCNMIEHPQYQLVKTLKEILKELKGLRKDLKK